MSTDVVRPLVSTAVIGAHEITVVPEAIPASLLDFFGEKPPGAIEVILDGGVHSVAAVGETPDADCLRRVVVLRLADQQLR